MPKKKKEETDIIDYNPADHNAAEDLEPAEETGETAVREPGEQETVSD